MALDGLSSILQSLCEDPVTARMLLGNPSFLKICAALAQQIDERFRQTVLLEKGARRSGGYEELDRSSFRNELHDALERDSYTIRALRNIGQLGGSFCEDVIPGGSNRATEARNRRERDEIFKSDDVPRDALELIVAGSQEAEQATKDLKRWLKDAQIISICDPYIFHFNPSKKKKREPVFKSADDYVEFIANLIPATARHVKLYGAGYTKAIRTALKRKLKEGRTLDIFDTFHIHDRYVIKDYSEGRMLGTSFGGFHNKIFTILPLPREDVQRILTFLRWIELENSIPQLDVSPIAST
jgi:hypothetical protein